MYHWILEDGNGDVEGYASTLHGAIESLVHYARGNEHRDFTINGHHMNEEFGLWISGGKVVHDDGSEFVPMNEWYEKLGGGKPAMTEADVLVQVNGTLLVAFRPQPSRGSAPTNPATLMAKGEGL